MILSKLILENFRVYGGQAEGKHLELKFKRGLTVLVGENDSGKTAVVDALRLLLGTTSQDYFRISEEDFHKADGNVSADFQIYCRFESLSDEEAARFLEWLSLEVPTPALELTLRASRVKRRNRSGVEIPTIEVTTRSGPNGQGKSIEGDIRAYLRSTYLKPLRDAEMEMIAGKGSRLSQLLLNHPELKDQGKPSDLPPVKAGEPPSPPPTLSGIMSTAEKWIQDSPSIIAAKKQLNEDYLQNLSIGTETLRGEITIGRGTDLKSILEKLELWVAPNGLSEQRTRHGMGINNLLFMAAEFLLLSEAAESGLPLLLIEEPEAHLHPQLQLRLMEFLEEKTAGESGVQVIMTTHSPNLSASADIENIVLMAGGKAFPLESSQAKLDRGDYRFLRRFLDTTKANLFFAKGVMIVEGAGEDLLLPTISRLIDRSFTKHGVSVVNVGSRGLFRYSRIFQRTSGPDIPIRVACISDRDIPPDEANDYVKKSEKRQEPKFESELVAEGKIVTRMKSLRKHDGGPVKTFISPQWTLEHDFALSDLSKEIHVAITLAQKLKNLDRNLTEEETGKFTVEAEDDYAKLKEQSKSPLHLATRIYQPLFEKSASKAETAEVLASILERISLTPEQWRNRFPKYLVDAIDYATGNILPQAAHALQN